MLAVAQLNLSEAPYVPPVLTDVALLALFVGPRQLAADSLGLGICRTPQTGLPIRAALAARPTTGRPLS